METANVDGGRRKDDSNVFLVVVVVPGRWAQESGVSEVGLHLGLTNIFSAQSLSPFVISFLKSWHCDL